MFEGLHSMWVPCGIPPRKSGLHGSLLPRKKKETEY